MVAKLYIGKVKTKELLPLTDIVLRVLRFGNVTPVLLSFFLAEGSDIRKQSPTNTKPLPQCHYQLGHLHRDAV